ncbi:MAG: hypothetical protein LUE93_08235 [Bacteroides sp.]|nr:hypothetical protein [Bacteroides sp.]
MSVANRLSQCNDQILNGKTAIQAASQSIGISELTDKEEFSRYAAYIKLCAPPATLPEPTGETALELISDPRSNLFVNSGFLIDDLYRSADQNLYGKWVQYNSTASIIKEPESPSGYKLSSPVSSNQYEHGTLQNIPGIVNGTTYTLSVYARSDNERTQLYMGQNQRSSNYTLTNEWQYYTFTWQWDNSLISVGERRYQRVHIVSFTLNNTFEIHSPVLVEGTQPYRWGETYSQRIQNLNDRVVYDKRLLNDAFQSIGFTVSTPYETFEQYARWIRLLSVR